MVGRGEARDAQVVVGYLRGGTDAMVGRYGAPPWRGAILGVNARRGFYWALEMLGEMEMFEVVAGLEKLEILVGDVWEYLTKK